MNDRELLELAASAAGYLNYDVFDDEVVTVYPGSSRATWVYWKPLTDDGDALRLAVKLNLSVVFGANYVCVGQEQIPTVNNAGDPYAAARRAIVRAAAAIAMLKARAQ